MPSRFSFLNQLEKCCGRRHFCSFLWLSGVYLLYFIEKFKEKCQNVFSNRSCLGCCAKAPLTAGVEESPRGPKVQNQTVKDPGELEGFWSTSTREMDNSVAPSQRSLSSITTSNLTLDSQSSEAGPGNPSDFVNNGLVLWNQMREQWTANRRTQNEMKPREPRISWNATYEGLLGTNKPFPQPIPLSEMVNFLVEVWEHEGLYD